jgi:hypothetical protein
MVNEITVTGPDLSLVVELLERARNELLVEIRHTDTASFRKSLRRRLDRVEALLQRTASTTEAFSEATSSS